MLTGFIWLRVGTSDEPWGSLLSVPQGVSAIVSRVWVLAGGVVLGALVIVAIVLAVGGSEGSATGASVLEVVPLVDG
jgi:hypothetical protein